MPLLHVSFFQIPLQKPLGSISISTYPNIGGAVDESNKDKRSQFAPAIDSSQNFSLLFKEGTASDDLFILSFYQPSSIHDHLVQLHSFPSFVGTVVCMYHRLIHRHHELVTHLVHILEEHSQVMALDPRFYHHLGHQTGPGSHISSSSCGASAITGITSPSAMSTSASAATLRSTASVPSLRAREGVAVSARRSDGVSSPTPGGNVKVVVRVRKFLPRGMVAAGRHRYRQQESELTLA